MTEELRQRLHIPADRVETLNALLLNPETEAVNALLAVVAKYGTPEAINAKAKAARTLPALREKIAAVKPEHLDDLDWIIEQRDNGAFISMEDYRRNVAGARVWLLGVRPRIC